MEYSESPEQATEYVRLALPLMNRNAIAPNPLHYAVFYEYVSGRDARLKASMDQALDRGGRLTPEFTEALYDQFFREPQERVAEQMRVEVRRLLSTVVEQLAASGDQADRYSSILESYTERLSADLKADELRGLVTDIIGETQAMRSANRELENRLNATTHELENLKRELETARHEASTDALTGVTNRKGFEEALDELVRAANRERRHLSLILGDIDHFKHFNDTHGHLVGDRLLHFIAKTLKNAVKGHDVVARFGGEEFAILLPETPLSGAVTVANKLRAQIERQPLRRTDTKASVGSVTMSFGVARYNLDEAPKTMVARADAALYRAKRAGRNQVASKQ